VWKRKKIAEWVPWYRAPNYDGTLTEAEKRELDAFRMQPKHPSAQYDDLPDEVQQYISKIQVELYDQKQDRASSRALFLSATGAALLYLTYKGCLDAAPLMYVGAALLLVVPWFYYRYEWNRNAEEFHPSNLEYPTDEAIRKEWELDYITRKPN
jgi:hypothetical protein